MTDNNHDLPSLDPSAGDWAHAVVRVGLSAIPGIGGPAKELFQALLKPPLLRRQQRWMENVGEVLLRLEQRHGVTPEALSTNECFIDTVLHATQVAMRNNQQEKLEALRAAIENSALEDAPDESLQQMFLHFVDTFTVWHIRILKLFDDPVASLPEQDLDRRRGGLMWSLSGVLEMKFPELEGQYDFYNLFWTDLHACGLVNVKSLASTITPEGAVARRSTKLGRQFLSFITDRE